MHPADLLRYDVYTPKVLELLDVGVVFRSWFDGIV